jgi:UDP-N-acetylmuramate--alanine ligase
MTNKIHFIGIGGIGLSALARFLKFRGFSITGSDIKESPITKTLRDEGIEVSIPHDGKNITDQDIVIYSAVIKDDNPEMIEARKKGMLVLSRKEALPFVLRDKKIFAVAGAHGKSTTSAMLSSMIECSMIIGAESKQYGSNMVAKDCDEVVFEADESDSSFLNIDPYIAIVTNAEPEHMEHYHYDEKRFYDAYRTFIKNAKIRVLNGEDDFLKTLKDEVEATWLYPSKDIKDVKTVLIDDEPYTSFRLKDIGTFEVFGVGEHIAINASLAILAALYHDNILNIKENLKKYRGIKKRFDIVDKKEKCIIIDDYAHHPTEIKATIDSAKKYANLLGLNKVTAIWQPHKYSRTIDNLEGFKECFEGVDNLVILPVYNVGEKEVEIDFETHFKKYNPILADRVNTKEHKVNILKNKTCLSEFKDGIILGLGAGDITYQIRGVA